MHSLSGLLGRHRQDDPFVAMPEIPELFLPCYSSARYVDLQDSRRRAITGSWEIDMTIFMMLPLSIGVHCHR